MNNLRELRLKNPDELVVRRHQLTILLFREGHVQAVINSDSGLRGNYISPWNKGLIPEEPWSSGHDIREKLPDFGRIDSVLSFRPSESVDDLRGENVGRNKLVRTVLEVVAKKLRFIG